MPICFCFNKGIYEDVDNSDADQWDVASHNRAGMDGLKGFKSKISTTSLKYIKGSGDIREEDEITRVIGCATMWHENSEEMTEMIKSIFRVDEDYSARWK